MNTPTRLVFVLAVFLSIQVNQTTAQVSTKDSLLKTPDLIGGIYDRPYIYQLGGNIAIGGYTEMNSNFEREEGIEEGLSFEARRFNIFIFSSISDRVKLTSELEFEHGTEEINIETALVDVLFHTGLNLRAGLLLAPIARFNVTHDGPLYDITDRPLVSTQIIPGTFWDVGFGFYGALFPTPFDRVTYEIYTINGLGPGVVGGSGEGTRIPQGKAEGFAEDVNGSPAFTGRLGFNPRFGGEVGFSFYTGIYNIFKQEGERLDDSRRLTILAVDAQYRWKRFYLRGEGALAILDIQESLHELFADKQRGVYADVGYTLLRRPLLGFPEASLIFVTRYDYIDLNDGKRALTGQNIGDSTHRLTTGFSFRPTSDTSIRLSYAHNWIYDQFNNLSHMINIQFGIATYF